MLDAGTQAEEATRFDGLLAAAATGDARAYEALVQPLLPALRRYVGSIAGNDADDVVSEVLLRVHSGLGRFRGDEVQFRRWVFKIALNRWIDVSRQRRDTPMSVVPEQVSDADSPEGVAIAEVENREVAAVLRLLPPARREVLMLRVVAGLSVEETAEALGKSPEAIRVLQHRALRSLAKHLRPEV